MRNGQALDSLMTYGWIVLVLAIIASSLYYLNIFGGGCKAATAKGFNEIVILPNDFTKYTDGSAEIIVSNAAPEILRITGMIMHDSKYGTTDTEFPLEIESGTTTPVTFIGLNENRDGTCATSRVSINYTTLDSEELRVSEGVLRGEVK